VYLAVAAVSTEAVSRFAASCDEVTDETVPVGIYPTRTCPSHHGDEPDREDRHQQGQHQQQAPITLADGEEQEDGGAEHRPGGERVKVNTEHSTATRPSTVVGSTERPRNVQRGVSSGRAGTDVTSRVPPTSATSPTVNETTPTGRRNGGRRNPNRTSADTPGEPSAFMITSAHSPLSIVQSRSCSPLPLTDATQKLSVPGAAGSSVPSFLVYTTSTMSSWNSSHCGDLIVGDAVEVPGDRIGGSDAHEERVRPRRNTLHPDIIGRRDALGQRAPTQHLDVVGDHRGDETSIVNGSRKRYSPKSGELNNDP
jgi:hypothetical protein